uniref:Uncharacterized protein n=1 Tax=Knipowitschia caucasica TaxID=637954 RepID=A0AAV2JUG7_KNICA
MWRQGGVLPLFLPVSKPHTLTSQRKHLIHHTRTSARTSALAQPGFSLDLSLEGVCAKTTALYSLRDLRTQAMGQHTESQGPRTLTCHNFQDKQRITITFCTIHGTCLAGWTRP